MEPSPTVGAGSTLLLDEHFGAGDDRFLAERLSSRAQKKLANFAPGWLADKRPWARRMLIEYVDDGCCRAYHRGLVKRLFKGAEAARDDRDEHLARPEQLLDGWGLMHAGWTEGSPGWDAGTE